MHKDDFAHLLDEIQLAEREVRKAGQAEYAYTSEDTFDNFNRLATSLNLSREKVLLVYLMKHMDGIISYVNGHKSQREDIRGRIKDARMYLALLWGMIEEESKSSVIVDPPPQWTYICKEIRCRYTWTSEDSPQEATCPNCTRPVLDRLGKLELDPESCDFDINNEDRFTGPI